MAIGNLYVHSADGRVEAYWTGGAGTGTLEYSLDSGGLSGWTTASAAITGTNNHYAHTLANSTTARWWRYSEGGAPITFADAAYANQGTFQDADGWSVVPLGVGKKCIFVTSAASTPAGSNSNTGLTPNSPVLTFIYARDDVGMNAGDHMLFQRGASFTISATMTRWASGASAIAKSMIGAYGPASVAKPHFVYTAPGGAGTGFDCWKMEHGGGTPPTNNVLMSLHCTTGTRVDGAEIPFNVYGGYTGTMDGILCEDLSADGCAGALVSQVGGGFFAINCVYRRCMFANSHGVGSAHDQAIFIDNHTSPLIEDMILVENGKDDTGARDQFSHNMYINDVCSTVTVRNILAIRGDIQSRPGGTWERIAVIESPLGFTAGGKSDFGAGYVSENATYQDCLVDGSMNRDIGLGWGFWTADGCNGQTGSTATITLKDTLINLSSLDGGTTVGTNQFPYICTSVLHTETQVVDGCVFARSSTSAADYGLVSLQGYPSVFRMVGSVLDAIDSRAVLSEHSASHPTWQLGDNQYYSARSDTATYGNGWFINENGATGRTVAGWASYAGDPTSGTSASQKLGSAPTFTAQRRITDYCDHIGLSGGAGSTVDDLSTACLAMRKGAWDVNLTAEYAIDWIRQGYDMPALLTPAAPVSAGGQTISIQTDPVQTDFSVQAQMNLLNGRAPRAIAPRMHPPRQQRPPHRSW